MLCVIDLTARKWYNFVMDDLYSRYRAVCVFKDAARAALPLVELASCRTQSERLEAAAAVFRAVAEYGADTTGEWLCGLVKSDDNPLSRAAARGERVSGRLLAQADRELDLFKRLAAVKPDDHCTDADREFFPKFGYGGFSLTIDRLVRYCGDNGCGILSCASAFVYDGTTDGFVPTATEPVRLGDLKNYAEEKAEVVKNTENFIAGLPAFNTLLYGDRGTGKSTTVRAVAYEYRDSVKVIELKKTDIGALDKIRARLAGLKQKFIVFVDDLSFEENDARVDGFKAALEGSLAGGGNVLLYCTSNRRHLVKETEREVKNRNDETQAELALFDRFGLVVTYINPDKAEFIDIFKQILTSRGVKWREEYASVAELAALKKGGRSPRAAKQIADLIESTYAEVERR